MNPLPDKDPATDDALLGALAAGNPAALARLMERHGGLVLSVARGVLRDHHAAEDVAQAVFLALARKARRLRGTGTVAPWLYRVTHDLAVNAVRQQERRRRREQEAAAMPSLAEPLRESLTPEQHQQLHAQLRGLPERYRAPLVLCYLEGQPGEQAAQALGLRPAALRKRLERGRDRLRRRLTRLGWSAGAAGAVTALLTAEAGAAPVPAALIAATTSAAAGGSISATVASLTQGALHMIFWNNVKTVSLITAACAVVTGTGVVVATQRPPANSSPPSGAGGTTGVTRVATTTPSTASPAPVSADAETCAVPWLRRAAREAAGIGNTSEKKLWLLGGIAVQWAKAGNAAEFRAAIAALEQAERGAGETNLSITAMFRYSGAMGLILRLVRNGQVDEAIQLCGSVREDVAGTRYEASVKQVLAQALAEAGKVPEARALAGNATGEAAASVAWGIAMGLAKTGKAAEAIEAAKSAKSDIHKSVLLTMVVQAQTAQGDMAGAKRTIQDLPAEAQEEAWNAVFAQQLRQQDVRGAKESLAAIKSPAKRQLHYLDLCFAQIQKGDLAGAQATALEMVGQSQELGAFNLVAIEMIKRGDETGAVAFREKISPKLRDRAAKDYRYYLVKASAEAGDAQRAVRHLEELPAAERNYNVYLSVASALHQAQDVAGARQYFQLAKAEAGDRLYRSLAFQMAQAGAVDEAVQLARGLTNAQAQAEALAGAVNGCVQAGSLERAWEVIGLMPVGSTRVAAAGGAADLAMRKGRQAELSAWIDALPGAWEKAQACLSAAANCPLLASAEAARPTAGGDSFTVFKPIDATQPGFYANGKWIYALEIKGDQRQGILKYDSKNVGDPQPGDYILTPWGWMLWQEKGNWLPVAEEPTTGTQLPDPAK